MNIEDLRRLIEEETALDVYLEENEDGEILLSEDYDNILDEEYGKKQFDRVKEILDELGAVGLSLKDVYTEHDFISGTIIEV